MGGGLRAAFGDLQSDRVELRSLGAGELGGRDAVIVLAGLLLAVVYVVFVTAVLRGIGALGVLLVLAVVAAFVWVLVDFGWIGLDDPGAVTWIVIAALSVVLAMGMYWGILWRRLSGQLEVDDDEG